MKIIYTVYKLLIFKTTELSKYLGHKNLKKHFNP